MSISIRTASMTITPNVNEASNGRTYFSTDVMEPVNYNVEFSSEGGNCLLYTSPSPRDKRQSRMPSSA